MPSDRSLVLFRGRTCTEFIQHLEQYKSPAEKYEAQIEPQNHYMQASIQADQNVERLFKYLLQDRSWTYIGEQEFNKESADAREVAERSETTRRQLENARAAIVSTWRESARNLVENQAYNTVSKICSLSRCYTANKAVPMVNRAIIARIHRTVSKNRT